MTKEHLQKYFERIGCEVFTSPTFENLSELQGKHMRTIPFENLNPLLDIPVLLDNQTLFQKLIIDKRGGYCYEQNIFLLEVLKQLKFKVRGITGRVLISNRPLPRRTHMLLLVTIEETLYIVDVGFGSTAACMPLFLQTDAVQQTPSGAYKILSDDNKEFILQTKINDNWRSLYMFDLQEQFQEDFEVGNWFTSTNHEANFKHTLMFSLKSTNCRFTLNNNTFTTYFHDGSKEQIMLKTTHEMRKVMNETFQVELNNLPGLDLKLENLINNSSLSS